MTIKLTKGNSINLSKEAPGINSFLVGLGWDSAGYGGRSIDLDSSIFCLDSNNKVVDLVYYGDLTAPGIKHHGDNRTGAGDGPDEQITVDLTKVPPSITKLVITINSFTGQTFGDVKNEFMHIIANNKIVVSYNPDYDKEADRAKSLVVANVIRKGAEWEVQAVGKYSPFSTLNELKGAIQNGTI